MLHYVGFDDGKDSHWACVLDGEGEVLLSRRVEATEKALEAFCSEIAELGVTDERVVGIDLTGGPAALLEAVLLGREGALRTRNGGQQGARSLRWRRVVAALAGAVPKGMPRASTAVERLVTRFSLSTRPSTSFSKTALSGMRGRWHPSGWLVCFCGIRAEVGCLRPHSGRGQALELGILGLS